MIKIYKEASNKLVVDVNNVEMYPISGRHFPIYDNNLNAFEIQGMIAKTLISDIKNKNGDSYLSMEAFRTEIGDFFQAYLL